MISMDPVDKNMMKNKSLLSKEDLELFNEAIAGTRRLQQDTVVHGRKIAKPEKRKRFERRWLQEQIDASYYFSDEYHPLLKTEGPTRYLRPGADHREIRKLRRGDYSPDLILDLHGLRQMQAKQALGALIAACRRESRQCACVIHGHGRQILKQQTPRWLAQHPDVLAFHQAPKEWGSSAALLVLITQDE